MSRSDYFSDPQLFRLLIRTLLLSLYPSCSSHQQHCQQYQPPFWKSGYIIVASVIDIVSIVDSDLEIRGAAGRGRIREVGSDGGRG